MRGTSTLIAVSFACASFPVPAAAQPSSAAPSAPPSLTQPDLESWLDGIVPASLREGDIAGLVISVVKGGRLLLAKGYGRADVARNIPMSAETVVRAASVSKTFTATAVMQLVELGKLELDRDVNDYLDFRIPAAFGRPVTLRNLLTHTAGFEETAYPRSRTPRSLRDHVLTVPERLFPPGMIPAYSNYGLTLAGYIVSRVSGEPFGQYVERHILGPLGMNRSVFRFTLPDRLEPAAKIYPVASADPYPATLYAELAADDAPAAALATTARDMTRFMLAQLQDGTLDGTRLLHAETLRSMQSPVVVPITGAQPIGLGLFRTDYHGHRVIGHSGDGEGAHADLRLLPDLGIGVFLAMNSDGKSSGLFPAAFTLRGRLFEAFVDRYYPTPAPADEPTAATARDHARLVAGEYAWSRQQRGDYQEALALIQRFVLAPVIRANDDGTIETPASLTLEAGGRTQRWREVGDFVWREVGGRARLVMDVKDGRVRSVWSDQSASVWVDLPVPFLRSARFNVPLLIGATVVLLLSTLWWPVGAVIRRKRGGGPPPASERLTRFAAFLGVLAMVGWFIAMAADLASMAGSARWIRLIQVVTLAASLGALAALADVRRGWRGRGVAGRTASIAVALALAEVAWFSVTFHLISVATG